MQKNITSKLFAIPKNNNIYILPHTTTEGEKKKTGNPFQQTISVGPYGAHHTTET
jgi:hypothetical protein